MHVSQPSDGPAASSPVTEDPGFPALFTPRMGAVSELDAAVATCRACPQLVAWREEVARARRRAFRHWEYLGRPVPVFSPPDGVKAWGWPRPHTAATAQGGSSPPPGDVLYAALHAIGFVSQPTATHRGDGMQPHDVWITVCSAAITPANATRSPPG
jgi:uracil-DNA glycosylase